MSSAPDVAKEIFLAALERPPEQRPEFLDRACGDNDRLRQRVLELLRLHEEPDLLLDKSRIDLGVTNIGSEDARPLTEQPGDTIGPYKLLQQIGEGGMGVVYMAQQIFPVERRVALKIIKPGMDTQQVIARFEAERQALAMMDHPNIAKVLDAGATTTGRPYFVMELVNGVSITQFCDDQHLPPKERLELFLPVCHAVQHAHQKGIIHRDLKPSNVLVALYDDKPVPKVIDFGVAKAVSHKLTEKTMFTQHGQIVGTVDYMSPEQAQFNQIDVDTRSDIYSLGVLLYELLTGETPFDKNRLRTAAFDELLRIIREEEPPRPSTKLSGSESRASTAANRKMEPRKLSLLVRGDLDWIVMKALEKDRNCRYDTANALATDVLHYLCDEPVQASPPGALYRFQKLVRRNKSTMISVALFGAMLILGVVLLAIDNVRIKQEQRRTAAQKTRAEAALIKADDNLQLARDNLQLSNDNLQLAEENLGLALESLDVYISEIDARFYRNRKLSPTDLEFLQKGFRFYQELTKRHRNHTGLQHATAKAYRVAGFLQLQAGQFDEAETLFRKSIPLQEKLVAAAPTAPEHRQELAHARRGLFLVLRALGRPEEAEPIARQAIDLYRRNIAEFPPLEIDWVGLGICHLRFRALLFHLGRYREAEEQGREALAIYERLAAEFPEKPYYRQETAFCVRYLGQEALRAQGRISEALQNIQRAIGIYTDLAAEFPANLFYSKELANSYAWLGNVYLADQKTQEAEHAYRQAVDMLETLVEKAPQTAEQRNRLNSYRSGLVKAILQRGGYAEAGEILAQIDDPQLANNIAWDIVYGPHSPPQAVKLALHLATKAVELEPSPFYWSTLAIAQYRDGDWNAAIDSLRKSEQLLRGRNFSYVAFFLAMAHWKRGEKKLALKWYAPALVCMEMHSNRNKRLLAIRAEAAALLGLPEKLTPELLAAKDDDVEFYNLVLEARPDAAWAINARGAAQVERRQWKDATDSFTRAVELYPQNPWLAFRLGFLLAQQDDLPAYQQYCNTILSRWGDTDDPILAERTAKACMLLPGGVPDPEQLAALLQPAIALGEKHGMYQWFLFGQGLLDYRCGRFAEAVDACRNSRQRATYAALPVTDLIVEAMALFRLGKTGEARQTLNDAAHLLDEKEPEAGNKDLAASWHDWLACHILLREATALIEQNNTNSTHQTQPPLRASTTPVEEQTATQNNDPG